MHLGLSGDLLSSGGI